MPSELIPEHLHAYQKAHMDKIYDALAKVGPIMTQERRRRMARELYYQDIRSIIS